LDAPLTYDATGIHFQRSSSSEWGLHFSPVLAYLRSLSHDSLINPGLARVDPLPRFSVTGYSLGGALSHRGARVLSIRYVGETETDILNESLSEKPRFERSGLEIGILGTYYLRSGEILNEASQIDLETEGWGLRLRGVLDILDSRGILPDQSTTIGWVLRHIDLRYDRAKYEDSPDLILSNIEFAKVVFSL
jgi:hypothetical protein